jgi:hypothetical protein
VEVEPPTPGTGLPDGVFFQTKNPNLGKFLEGLATEGVGTFYGRLVYFVAIWYILWPFSKFISFLVYFPHLYMFSRDESGNPDLGGFLLSRGVAVHMWLCAASEQ